MKELLKTTVSFWLRTTISHIYLLSGMEQPVLAPRARVSRDIAPSLLFKKNFAVNPVWNAGAGCRLAAFPRRYLRDVVCQSLNSFHLGPVVAVQALVSPWPARLDIPLLIDSPSVSDPLPSCPSISWDMIAFLKLLCPCWSFN